MILATKISSNTNQKNNAIHLAQQTIVYLHRKVTLNLCSLNPAHYESSRQSSPHCTAQANVHGYMHIKFSKHRQLGSDSDCFQSLETEVDSMLNGNRQQLRVSPASELKTDQNVAGNFIHAIRK